MELKISNQVPPTEEQMISVANDWWQNHIGINFLDWNPTLRKNSFDCKIVKIDKELIKKTIDLGYDNIGSFDELLEEYTKILQPVINNLNSESFFIKFISRSPKDSLSDDNNHGKPKPLYTISEALGGILSSMRCFDDMMMLYYLDKAYLVIRPYIDFNPLDEWRVVIKDRKIIGISQYYYFSTFPKLTDEYVNMSEIKIRNMINNIVIPNVNLDNFVADIIVENEKCPTIVLELNPYGLSDPCLFKSYDKFDGSIKWNKI